MPGAGNFRAGRKNRYICFIDKQDIPTVRWQDVTYGRVIVNYIPEKQNPNRASLTVSRDRVTYHGDCETPTVDLLTFKILLNSIISTPGAKFITIDTKKIYLKTPLERSKYMRMKLSDLPEYFVKQYNFQEKITKDGYV